MYSPEYTKRFEKDIKLQKKRGKKTEKIKAVMAKLLNGEKLESKHKDHKLTGNYKLRRECHIEPAWLLIYQFKSVGIILFERTGTHADLFE